MPVPRELSLPGAWAIAMQPVVDERGWFGRYCCMSQLDEQGTDVRFVQFNHSVTRRAGSIRGMHLQLGPAAEDKLVKAIRGRVVDVLLDLRVDSPTFLQHERVELSAENATSVFIPKGVAHGFQTLEANTELIYHHSNYHSPEHEWGVRFDDPMAAIEWPREPRDISDKDRGWPLLSRDFAGFRVP